MMVPSSPNEISWRGRRALSGTGKTPTDVKSLTVTWFDAQTLSSNFGLARLQFGEAPEGCKEDVAAGLRFRSGVRQLCCIRSGRDAGKAQSRRPLDRAFDRQQMPAAVLNQATNRPSRTSATVATRSPVPAWQECRRTNETAHDGVLRV